MKKAFKFSLERGSEGTREAESGKLHFPVAWVRFRSDTEAEFFGGSRSAMRVFFLRVLGFLYSPKFNSPGSNFQWVKTVLRGRVTTAS